jgi:putative oxidoreductase
VNIVLWVLQIVLGLMFLFAGVQKAFRPLDAISTMMTWVPAVPASLVRFIGVAELLAGIGLILPGLTGVLPSLTIWAGLGLAVVMVCAVAFHATRREYSAVAMNIVFLALAAFVAWGRWRIAAF